MYKRQVGIISTVALILLLSVGSVSAAIRTVTIRVKGMTCGGCATSVEKAFESTEGVQTVRVSFERGAKEPKVASAIFVDRDGLVLALLVFPYVVPYLPI